jgi:hypothetical protein
MTLDLELQVSLARQVDPPLRRPCDGARRAPAWLHAWAVARRSLVHVGPRPEGASPKSSLIPRSGKRVSKPASAGGGRTRATPHFTAGFGIRGPTGGDAGRHGARANWAMRQRGRGTKGTRSRGVTRCRGASATALAWGAWAGAAVAWSAALWSTSARQCSISEGRWKTLPAARRTPV